ncbi:hypothetical protein OSTOST_21879 [Ostertagia ostertagi]
MVLRFSFSLFDEIWESNHKAHAIAFQVEKDCHIIVGCLEQSEDGTIFVKQNLALYIYRDSVGCFAGRIVCSRLDMRCFRRCQYDGYLKANDAEIYLPYMNESQLIATGQMDILVSPLTLKGNRRLTNCEHKQNHVKRCHIVVEEMFLNEGTLACNSLDIVGEGVLENKNRIFAVDSMDIRLNNFSNDDGLMESKNSIKLLSATKEWTKLGGSIKAKRGFDLCAHKLDMALNDVHKLINEKKLSFLGEKRSDHFDKHL